MADTLDVVALASLLEMVGDDPDFVAELVDTYLADAPTLLAEMRGAVEAGGADDLLRPAHTLKGNSLNIGAAALAGLCRTLEEDARAGSLDGAAGVVAEAESEYDRVVLALAVARERGWKG